MRAMTVATALLALGPTAVPAIPAHAAEAPGAAAWEIGPVIRGRNYSVGMPLRPTPGRRGWYFDFPSPVVSVGHVHSLTFNHGPLTGKRRIVMRYRVDAERGVRFVPQEDPDIPGTISLFFQRRGDTWRGRGRYETYRWYSPDHTVVPIARGEHVLTVSLDDGNWIPVHGATAAARPTEFRQAIDEADRVGFVLGSTRARGHGVYATGAARLTVLSFQVI